MLVLEKVTGEAGQGGMNELLCADDLVLSGKSKEEVTRKFLKCKRAIEINGL